MGRHGRAAPHRHRTRQGPAALYRKKSLTRLSLAGKAKLGRAQSTQRAGRRQATASDRIDWPRSLAAKGQAKLARPHLRYRKQPAGAQLMHCVLLDTSASMLRGQQLARAKGYLQALAEQAYRQRDRLCVLGFSGDSAYVIQAGAKAQALNDGWIRPIAGGGGSPLASAITLLERLLQRARRQGPVHACVWLLSDGRFAQVPERPSCAEQITVVGFDQGGLPLQLSQRLASQWQAAWIEA